MYTTCSPHVLQKEELLTKFTCTVSVFEFGVEINPSSNVALGEMDLRAVALGTSAERFGKTSGFKTPVIESTGSGGGLKLFCKGLGTEHPDITNASRRIKMKEVKKCSKNGVTDITEIKVGFDGIAMANAKAGPALELTLKDIYLALAKVVPADPEGNTVKPNPYKMWNEVNPNLPAAPIVVVGPPPTSGTRDAFNELAIERGCKKFPGRKALKKRIKNFTKKNVEVSEKTVHMLRLAKTTT